MQIKRCLDQEVSLHRMKLMWLSLSNNYNCNLMGLRLAAATSKT